MNLNQIHRKVIKHLKESGRTFVHVVYDYTDQKIIEAHRNRDYARKLRYELSKKSKNYFCVLKIRLK